MPRRTTVWPMDRRTDHLWTCATPDCNRKFSMSSQSNVCCSGCGTHVAPAMRVHTSRCQREQRHLGRRDAALVVASATTCRVAGCGRWHLPGFRTCCSRCHDSGGRRHSSRCMEVTRRLHRGELETSEFLRPVTRGLCLASPPRPLWLTRPRTRRRIQL